MKLLFSIIMVFAALVFVVSCGEKEQKPAKIDKSSGSEIPQPGASIEQRMKDFSSMMKSQFETINKNTGRLKERINEIPIEKQAEFEDAIKAITNQMKIVNGELKNLEKATKENWDKFAPKMNDAMNKLKHAYQTAESYLKQHTE